MNKPTTTTERLPLKLGSRVRLTRDVERFSDFLVKAGALGVCTCANDGGKIAVRMDDYIEGAQHWQNEIWWENSEHGNFDDDAEVLPVVRLVRVRCEGDQSWLSRTFEPALGDVFTLNKSEALILAEDDARINREYRSYLSHKGEGKPIYYIEPCGLEVNIAPERFVERLFEKPIRVYVREEDCCGFFFLNDELWSAPANRDGSLEMENALPVNEWECEPLDEKGWTDVCTALKHKVPAIKFEASIRFLENNTRTTVYGRGHESKERNAVALITEVAALQVSPVFTFAQRDALLAVTIHTLGRVLTAAIESPATQEVEGSSIYIKQSR